MHHTSDQTNGHHPHPDGRRDHRSAVGVVAMPQALRDRLAAAGVEETPSVRRAAGVLVGGKLAARTRARGLVAVVRFSDWFSGHIASVV